MSRYFDKRLACPSCNAGDYSELLKLDYSHEALKKYIREHYSDREDRYLSLDRDAHYSLLRCDQCGLIYQQEIPNDEFTYKIYEEWIGADGSREASRKRPLKHTLEDMAEIVRVIKYFNRPAADIKMLDFGMGWAAWVSMARALGTHAVGMELSEIRIANARQMGIEVVDWKYLEDHQFDMINTEQVFEHLPDPGKVLGRLSQSLNNGGLIKISVPNGNHAGKLIREIKNDPSRFVRGKVMVIAPLEHINCFSHRSLLALADQYGLVPVPQLSTKAYLATDIKSSVSGFLKYLYKKVFRAKGTYIFFKKK